MHALIHKISPTLKSHKIIPATLGFRANVVVVVVVVDVDVIVVIVVAVVVVVVVLLLLIVVGVVAAAVVVAVVAAAVVGAVFVAIVVVEVPVYGRVVVKKFCSCNLQVVFVQYVVGSPLPMSPKPSTIPKFAESRIVNQKTNSGPWPT